MSDYINAFKGNFEKVMEYLQKEIGNLRVGRATPAMVENIKVDAYGTLTPLIHLSSISTPDPKTIAIQPWDKNLLQPMSKAIQQSDLGISPVAKDNLLLLNIPSLTEETRKEILKKLGVKLEEARVSVRGQREKIKEEVLRLEKAGEISEDDKFRRLEELDELVKDYNEKIKEVGAKKEGEIMTV